MLGNEIRRARKENGLTQLQLSKKISCSNQVLSEIERGKCNPSLDLLYRICNELGLQIALEKKGAVKHEDNRANTKGSAGNIQGILRGTPGGSDTANQGS